MLFFGGSISVCRGCLPVATLWTEISELCAFFFFVSLFFFLFLFFSFFVLFSFSLLFFCFFPFFLFFLLLDSETFAFFFSRARLWSSVWRRLSSRYLRSLSFVPGFIIFCGEPCETTEGFVLIIALVLRSYGVFSFATPMDWLFADDARIF